MKIKLAILDSDGEYLRRLGTAFNSRYSSQLEIYSSTDSDAIMNCLEEKRIDVLLAAHTIKIDASRLPKRCGFAYLVPSADISSFNGEKAICKFQRGELLYKQILSIYSEHTPALTPVSASGGGAMKTIAFTSPAGGVGTSSLAAAFAVYLARAGKRVLYLNCEVYGEADNYFRCDGQADMSSAIIAVKSTNMNRAMKLQSSVKQDECGVCFYSSVKVPIDMMDMEVADYLTLQKELAALGSYDYLVTDTEFPHSVGNFEFFEQCSAVVLVSDGTPVSEAKTEKAISAINVLDERTRFGIQPLLRLIRNKCPSGGIYSGELAFLGSLPVYQSVPPYQMVRQLSQSSIFSQLM